MKRNMRLAILILSGICLFIQQNVHAQSPYAIAPKWYFGRQGGMNFSGGTPVVMTGGQVNGLGQEASSTMCDPSGNVLFYTDSYRLYDGNNNFVQNIRGGTSSTNSSVCFPDPSDPTNLFYLITANEDFGGGGDHNSPNVNGIYWYRIQKTGPGTISVVAGPNQLAANNEVTEQLCSGSDGNGGYWVVAHQGGGTNGNQIWSWHFTSAGVGTKQISSIAGTDAATTWQGSLKINKCQNLLAAVYWSGKVEVYNWNQTTGMVTSLYRSYTLPSAFVYGCEFSPNGNILYFTSLVGNQLYQYDLVGNVVLALGGGTSSNNVVEMGTLQLGPDDNIYVTNVANFAQPCYIGVVNDPNNPGAACNYDRQGFILNNNAPGLWFPNIYRGIANQAWINPNLTVNNTGACKDIDFSYLFQTYFGANVSVLAGSEQWDFGDGGGLQSGLGATPSHSYATGGNYTITLKVTDATCNTVWTQTKTITVNNCGCTPPTAPTSITISTGRDICSNFSGNVTLTANGGTTADAVEWFTGSCGGTLVYTGNPLVLPLSSPLAGTYKYFIRRTNACGSTTCITDSVVVHELPTSPTSALPAASAFCEGTTGNTSLSATGGSGETLVWYSGACGSGTSLGNGSPLSVSIPANTTNYFVRWESTGCPASSCAQATITINPLPSASFTEAGSTCANGTMVYTAAASANTFLWTYTTSGTGSITSGQGTNQLSINVGNANGTVTLTETTAASCSSSVSVPVTITTPSGIAAQAGADKNTCVPNVQLSANNTAGTWTVISGTGTFSPDATTYNATVSGLSNGLNEFEWTTTGTCGFTSSDQVAITLSASNLSVVIAQDDDTLCIGTSKNLNVTIGGTGSGDYTFVWTSSDNSFNYTTTVQNITVTPVNLTTTYYVTLQDNQNTGCTASDETPVVAISSQELVIPNLITPNGDDSNDYLEIRDENEREILPGANLEVVNRWGDRVYYNSSYKNNWNANHLSDGVYYYRLETGCGTKTYKGWLQVIH